jgi:hypothetical protein
MQNYQGTSRMMGNWFLAPATARHTLGIERCFLSFPLEVFVDLF